MTDAVEVPQEHSLASLSAMTDAQLSAVLGFDQKIGKFKNMLAEASALTGDAKKYAEQKIADRLAPRMDSYDMDYIVQDAKRMAKKNGKEELADCSPCSCI